MSRANGVPFPSSVRTSATRRGALGLLGGGLLAQTAIPVASAAIAAFPLRDLRFDIYRKGEKIGEHGVRFSPAGDGRRAVTEVDLAVKVAFITAYRYAQTGEDVWRDDGVLVSTRIRTVDDGKETLVTIAPEDGRLRVSGPKGDYALPFGAMTDINFWNEAITRQSRLIDSQTGELVTIAVKPDAVEKLAIGGRTITARRFAMSATKGRGGTAWYDEAGSLVQATVLTRGETLEYRLAA
ncbi:DUF6134 family protein [Benzoatithermus flavus]|uniref:DUF6134 family protein n=1 Tax=Benzoatithermus flavus TaxID=3108223 RepID=A0ABU8XS63_9PROT